MKDRKDGGLPLMFPMEVLETDKGPQIKRITGRKDLSLSIHRISLLQQRWMDVILV
jgi:hypothetical protein